MAEKKQAVDGSLALQENQRRVITIEATKPPQGVKLRVAAYARVSTSSEDQLNSFAAQNRYYSAYIASRDDWTMVDLYADEGITGTSADKRKEFQRLLRDCRKGKIDRVLVKSVSRFARNTKECLEAVRELKLLGVSILFEEQKIDTSAMSSEMLTTIFASLAQKESESIAANLRWSYVSQMKEGSFVSTHQPFGYRLDGKSIVIDECAAEVVWFIFREYLAGNGVSAIARKLNGMRSEMPLLSQLKWEPKAVSRILKNEHYTGNSLWQKTYRTDTMPKKDKVNHGERPQYYAENTHPAIISAEDFRRVQALMQKKAPPSRNSETPVLKGAVECRFCGSHLRRKEVRDRSYWVCRTHELDKAACPLSPVPEEQLTGAFLRMYFNLKNHPEILDRMYRNLLTVRNRRMLWSPDVVELNTQIGNISSQVQTLTALKQRGLVDPDVFISKNNELTEQLRKVKEEKERLTESEQDETIRRTLELMELIDSGPDFPEAFDRELFGELVEKMIVDSGECLHFRLKNGLELAETMERTVR